MKTQVLGFDIDALSFAESLKRVDGFLAEDRAHVIYTPNPEIIMAARKDKEYAEVLKTADLSVADGIGVVMASKFNRVKIPERVTGYDLALSMLERYEGRASFYFFGGKPGVGLKAKAEMEKKFPGLSIVGVSDGYFDAERERSIVADINAKKPDVLFIGLSMVMAEKWAARHRAELNVRVILCFGGVLDHFAGDLKRAPAIWSKLGLEWLYRLFTLRRFKRQLELLRFVGIVIADNIGFGKGSGRSK